MKLILKVCGYLNFALVNVVAHIYDLFDVTFLIRNGIPGFIIVPMRKYYPRCNDLLMVVFCRMHLSKIQNKMKSLLNKIKEKEKRMQSQYDTVIIT